MNYSLLIFAIVCIASTSAAIYRFEIFDSKYLDEWNSFKKTFNKKYQSESHERIRRIQWQENLKYIERHNLEADLGKHSFRLGINEYADLSTEEFREYLCGNVQDKNGLDGNASTFLAPNNVNLPNSVDWRNKGYVTPVKNQKACGSCWAFSATGSLEGQHFKKSGRLISLSEQNLIDCSRKFGNHGCNGGNSIRAFKYIKENNGIDTEVSYPYEGRDSVCRFKKSSIGAVVTGYAVLKRPSESDLQTAVATVGPISVSIDASQKTFHLYNANSGIYDEPKCSSTKLNHAVLVVGYGTEGGKDYWLVKNSWGTSWGYSGYIKMSRNKGNQCGIATRARFPLV